MSLFNEVICTFYNIENSRDIKSDKFQCTVVSQSGFTSFGIYEIGLQFLIYEKALREALLECDSIKVDGIYMDFTDKEVSPIKCKIKIDAEINKIEFNILNLNNVIQIKTEYLVKILNAIYKA